MVDNTNFEIRKIYLIVVIGLSSLYYFELNPLFNKDLNNILNQIGVNIYFVGFVFIFIGLIVFRLTKDKS